MFLPTIPTPPFNDCMREFHIVRNRESERGPCPIAFAFYQACSTQGVHPSENLKQNLQNSIAIMANVESAKTKALLRWLTTFDVEANRYKIQLLKFVRII